MCIAPIWANPNKVNEYLRRAEQAGLVWPLPDAWDDAGLEQILFPDTYKDSALERGLPIR
ncbi:hypothetical protein [Nitrosomonas aestuarii]|uniref:hypothetical protein n=1 Tax=Nitrosomonas aestuarii TaxID=52441 RepID=UPI000B88EE6A|nr:hypothetical protein [Nitrosomonas aestuarii]